MSILFANYFSTTLPVTIGTVQTSIVLNSVVGFPAVGGANYCYLTLVDPGSSTTGSGLVRREIVKVTAISGNTVTCVRGVDSTNPTAMLAGDLAEIRFNAQAALDLIASAGAPSNASYVTVLAEGALSAERVLTGSSSIQFVDAGANTTITASVPLNAITNAFAAQMATLTIKGNNTGGTANALDLTATQVTAMLNPFVASGAGHLKGLVPDPGVTLGTTKFLCEDATFKVPAGSGAPINSTYICVTADATLTNERTLAVSAELTLSDGGANNPITLAIAPNGVTRAMLAQGAATSVIGNATGGAANVADITFAALSAALPVFGASGASHAVGQVPDPGGSAGSVRFLREDATFAIPPGGGGSAFVPNLFRNSGMIVNQRAIQTLTTSPLIGSVDSWAAWMSSGTAASGTITQVLSAIGITGYLLQVSAYTTVGGVVSMRQRIEAKDAVRLKNQTVSIQFGVFQDTAGAVNYTIFVRKPTVADNFAATTNISNSGAISVNANTYTNVAYNGFAIGDCSNGIEVELQAAVGTQTGKNCYYSEAQIIGAANAQSFQCVPFAVDYDWVRRYYQKSFAYATAPAQNAGVVNSLTGFPRLTGSAAAVLVTMLPMPMRTAPTFTTYNPSAANAQVRDIGLSLDCTAVATATNGISGEKELNVSFTTAAGSGVGSVFGVHWTADAEF